MGAARVAYRPSMQADATDPGHAPAGDGVSVVDRLTTAARSLVHGRRVVLAHMPMAGAASLVAQLVELGAERVFVVAPTFGTGPPPDPATTDGYDLDIRTEDTMEIFRRFERAMVDPPAGLRAALDAFDPTGEALVLVMPYDGSTSVVGRPAFGPRRPAWVAIEDKTTNDALFERAGVRCAPSEVVAAADEAALRTAAARLDAGAGTVWSGDATAGFNGGATLVRWVTDPGAAADAAALMASRCQRVRVAPFLDGIPCSIHGIVTTDGVAVFRPMEMVTLRTTDPPGFRYGGVASFWDPPAADRAVMRDAARRVGALLRDEVGFAGSYGIDGVVTADGFLPTEVNPRFGGGLSVVARAVPELPLFPLHWITAAGEPIPVTAAELEATLTAAADARRGGGGWVFAHREITETSSHPLVVRDGTCRPAGDDVPDATLVMGPGAEGGFVRCEPDPARTPVGPSIAPLVCAVLAWADAEFDLGLGSLVPAPDLARRVA